MINNVLKGELGFEGFVVSDWAAIDKLDGDYKSDIERSINAGIDIVSFSHNLADARESNGDKVHRTIRDLVDKGEIPQYRIRESYRRIINLKGRIAAGF